MNVSTPSSSAERKHADRLDIACRLYWALVAQNPDRQIRLCDGRGRVLARTEPLPEQGGAPEIAS